MLPITAQKQSLPAPQLASSIDPQNTIETFKNKLLRMSKLRFKKRQKLRREPLPFIFSKLILLNNQFLCEQLISSDESYKISPWSELATIYLNGIEPKDTFPFLAQDCSPLQVKDIQIES